MPISEAEYQPVLVGPAGLGTHQIYSRLSVSPAVHSSHIIRMLHSMQTMVYISIPIAAPCASSGSWLMADSVAGELVVDGGDRDSTCHIPSGNRE